MWLSPIHLSTLILVSSLGKSIQWKKHTNVFFLSHMQCLSTKEKLGWKKFSHENESYHQQFTHFMNIFQRAPISFTVLLISLPHQCIHFSLSHTLPIGHCSRWMGGFRNSRKSFPERYENIRVKTEKSLSFVWCSPATHWLMDQM